jgi:hypothetical protein
LFSIRWPSMMQHPSRKGLEEEQGTNSDRLETFDIANAERS